MPEFRKALCCWLAWSQPSLFLKSLRICVLLITAFALSFEAAKGQNEKEERAEVGARVTTVKGKYVIRSLGLGNLGNGLLDLGAIESGAKVRAIIEIRNSSGQDLLVREVVSGCNCLRIEADTSEFVQGSLMTVVADFEVPKVSRATKKGAVINFKGVDINQSFSVMLQYDIAGLSSFALGGVATSVPPNVSSALIRVPVLIIPPLKSFDVVVEGRGDLLNVTGNFVADAESNNFVIELDVPSHGEFKKVGELVMTCSKSGAVDSIPFVIDRKPNISVYPDRILFYEEDGVWKATAIIRVNKNLLGENSGSLIAAATFDKASIKVNSTNMGSGLLRVQLSIDGKQVQGKLEDYRRDQLSPRIQWQVSWSGGIEEFDTRVSFP